MTRKKYVRTVAKPRYLEIMAIVNKNPDSVTSLAKKIGCKRETMHYFIHKLLRDGFVKQTILSNYNRKIISLTVKGYWLLKEEGVVA